VKGLEKYYFQPMDDLLAVARILVNIEEKERRAIARELHERLGQSLTVLKLLLGEAVSSSPEKTRATLAEAQSLVNELMSLTRALSLDLRPKMLDDLGLLPALLYLFESYTSRTHVNVKFEHYGLHKKFPSEVGIAAYRIIQEALENVAKHASIHEVRVLTWSGRRWLYLQIEDRGVGFEPDKIPAEHRQGLDGMRGRVLLVEGKFILQSATGGGTMVTAELPLPQKFRKI
jgi:signal transduction histidine kinase